MSTLSQLEDKALLASLHALVGSHRRVTGDIVAHLGEVDERRLHLTLGFSSLFDYCLRELRFSEDEAYRRIEVARLARRFPAILTALEQGTSSLSALALLKPHLNEHNCVELLAAVSDVSVRIAKKRLGRGSPCQRWRTASGSCRLAAGLLQVASRTARWVQPSCPRRRRSSPIGQKEPPFRIGFAEPVSVATLQRHDRKPRDLCSTRRQRRCVHSRLRDRRSKPSLRIASW